MRHCARAVTREYSALARAATARAHILCIVRYHARKSEVVASVVRSIDCTGRGDLLDLVYQVVVVPCTL